MNKIARTLAALTVTFLFAACSRGLTEADADATAQAAVAEALAAAQTATPNPTDTPQPSPTSDLFSKRPADYLPSEEEMPQGYELMPQLSKSADSSGLGQTEAFASNAELAFSSKRAAFVLFIGNIYESEKQAQIGFNALEGSNTLADFFSTDEDLERIDQTITQADQSAIYAGTGRLEGVPMTMVCVNFRVKNAVFVVGVIGGGMEVGNTNRWLEESGDYVSLILSRLGGSPPPSVTVFKAEPETGSFSNLAPMGRTVVRQDVPLRQYEMAATVLEVVRGAEAVKLAQSSRNGDLYEDPLEGQEYLAVRVRLEVKKGPQNEVYKLVAYGHFTLRYEEAGSDIWNLGGFEPLAQGYPPLDGVETWIFFVVDEGSEPLLYFQPNLMVSEQFGGRTQGAYFELTQ